MAVTNNLYPPIVDTYMPAFLVGDNSSGIHTVTKTYIVTSYSDVIRYEAAVDQFITNSDISGVEELWDEYEAALAEIAERYPDPADPERIEEERLLHIQYKNLLDALLEGSSTETLTEAIFFATKPEPTEISKRATFQTVTTTDDKYICRVYFSLSMYNDLEEIQNAQITVRNQNTNKNVLHSIKYPSGIMLKQIQIDEERETNDKYYIEIKPEDLNGNNFDIDTYYKVQIRFTSVNATDPGINLSDEDAVQSINEWLSINLDNFSEWSTVCLIRGISEPTVEMKDYDEGGIIDIYDSIINTQVIGKISFANPNETETLKFYRIKVYNSEDTLLLDSGDIYSNDFTDINNFNYTIKYWFKAEHTYRFTFTYVTSNLFTDTKTYYISVLPAIQTDLGLRVKPYMDEENGRIGMRITRSKTLTNPYTGKIVIRRASSKDNYNIWDDIYTASYKEARNIDFTWFDYTVENGIFYLYGVQGITPEGNRTEMYFFQEPICCYFEDIFLTSGDKQLKIKFNPSITSFQRTIQESKVDTIGSKYPFIKRNGFVDYVQFPLNGLIASAMDEDGLFITKKEVYQDNLNIYEEYNEKKDIKYYNDFIWERFFREKVSNFLYDDGVKLFRSPSEGNFLVRLMNISFQPNQTLGRRLWNFQSTAYEVDECNWENYGKYNIISTTNKGPAISGGGSSEPTISAIQRVVFIDSIEEFPAEGKDHVLYIFENQCYLWNSERSNYNLISVPLWNDRPNELIAQSHSNREIYADNEDLYLWDNQNRVFNKISVSENNTPLIDPVEGE